MEEIAQVYARSLFEVAKEQDKLDVVREQLGQFAEALEGNRELLVENHRMPAVFRVRRELDRLWQQENQLLPVTITSAVALDEATVRSIGDAIGQQTGQRIALTANVDPDVLGGLVVRVGNSILDASIRNRLEQLRSEERRVGKECRSRWSPY